MAFGNRDHQIMITVFFTKCSITNQCKLNKFKNYKYTSLLVSLAQQIQQILDLLAVTFCPGANPLCCHSLAIVQRVFRVETVKFPTEREEVC